MVEKLQVDSMSSALAVAALLGGFEQDLRGIISEYLIDPDGNIGVLKTYDLTNRMLASDTDAVNYLYIGEALDILNANQARLPAELQQDFKNTLRRPENEAAIHRIRKNSGHFREQAAFELGDLEAIFGILSTLTSPDFRLTLERIKQVQLGNLKHALDDVFKLPSFCLNNLPEKDYKATTLVGRRRELTDLLDEISNPYNPIVSVIAPGGLGKTSLALEAAWQLAESANDYEIVLWHSAKTDYWTVDGVRHDDSVTTDLESALAGLGKVLDPTFEGGLDDFLEILGDIPTLLVLDNFETYTGSDFLGLFRKFPRSSKIKVLITSRRGIGSNEFRFELGPLEVSSAVALVMKMCKIAGVPQLLQLTESSRVQLVQDFSCKPLDLKWFVQSLASGKTIQEIKNATVGLLEFCVKSVLQGLSETSRNILGHLYISTRNLPLVELHLLLNTQLVEELTPSIHELLQSGIITLTLSPTDPDIELVGLSEVANNYLEKIKLFSDAEISNLRKRRVEVQHALDESEHPNASPTNPYVVSKRNREDDNAAILLHKALASSRKDLDKALATVADARNARRGYFEVNRVEAFLIQKRDSIKAQRLFELAIEEATTTREKAIVAYHFADFLGFEDKLVEAVRFAEIAHTELNLGATSKQLGYLLARRGDFDHAIALLEDAISRSTGKTKLVAITALAKAMERWADKIYRESKNLEDSVDKIFAGIDALIETVRYERLDFKIMDMYCELIASGIKICLLEATRQPTRVEQIATILLAEPELISKCLSGIPADSKNSVKLNQVMAEFSTMFPKVKVDLLGSARLNQMEFPGDSQRSLRGTVRRLNLEKGYGFIDSSSGTQYFLSRKAAGNTRIWHLLSDGERVEFDVDQDTLYLEGEGKSSYACNVRPIR